MAPLTEIDTYKLARIARAEAEAAAIDEVGPAIQLLIDHLSDLTEAEAVVVDLERAGDLVSCYSTSGLAEEVGSVRSVATSAIGYCFSLEHDLRTPNIHRDPRFPHGAGADPKAVSMISVPLHVNGPAVGLVRVMSSEESHFDVEDVAVARLLTGSIARILMHAVRREIGRMKTEPGSVSVASEASGFADRRKAELRLAARYGYQVTIVHCHLDGYVTSEILEMIPSLVRSTDGCFRLDAADFAILMPATSAEQAALVAGRIRTQVEASGDGIRLGWTIRPESGEGSEVA